MRRWLLVLMTACGGESLAPAPTPPELTFRVACASVWSIELDGHLIDTRGQPQAGALWYFPAAGDYGLAIESGSHRVMVLRWTPTISAGRLTTVGRGDVLDLPCED